MQQKMNKVQFLTGNLEMLETASSIPVLPVWSDKAVDLLASFSQNLLSDPRTKNFPDIISYAFWIRCASLKQIKEHYYPNIENKIGRGIAFHIAPSNVPVNFAVSFTSSLLAGNLNIVRLSSKLFEQAKIMIEALKKVFLDGKQDMEQYLILIRYEHDAQITQYLSSMCDVRIIWGGNQTINLVRQAAIPPRAIEMAFADRYSIALMDSEAVLEADMEELAGRFYTDTYYIDQNACSSPGMVVWFGRRTEEAKQKFWNEVGRIVSEKYDMQVIQAVDKLEKFCCLAANNEHIHLINRSNRVIRIETDNLTSELMDYKMGGGYFFEYEAKRMEDIIPIMGKSCQTISYYGIEPRSVQNLIITNGLRGGDRIVPVGKTMDLTFKWDGFDMIQAMSRYVYCPNYKPDSI